MTAGGLADGLYKVKEAKNILRLSDLQLKGKYHDMLNVVLDLQQNNGQHPRAKFL